MSTTLLLKMAMIFATTALVSVGGIAAMIPEIHRQAVELNGWMTNDVFASTFAISQIAPGPNIMLMSLVGWRVAGAAGLIVATLATVVPTSLVALAASRAENKLSKAVWYSTLRKALPPIVVGLIFASGLVTGRVAVRDWITVAIALGVAAWISFSKSNPLVPLAGAVVVGVIAGRMGYL